MIGIQMGEDEGDRFFDEGPITDAKKRQLARLRRKIRDDIKATNKAWDKHNKKYNCKTDSGGCTDRAKYQERIATLQWVLLVMGGRVEEPYMGDSTIQGLFPKIPIIKKSKA